MLWKNMPLFILVCSLAACEPINPKVEEEDGSNADALVEIEGIFIAHDQYYSCQSNSEDPNTKLYGKRGELRIFDSEATYTDGCSDAIETIENNETPSIQISEDKNLILFRNKIFRRFEFASPEAVNQLDFTLNFLNYSCTTNVDPPSVISSYVDKIVFLFPEEESATFTYLGNECNDALEMDQLEDEWLMSFDKQLLLGRNGIYQLTRNE